MAKGNNVPATCLRLNGLLNLSNHGNRATLAIGYLIGRAELMEYLNLPRLIGNRQIANGNIVSARVLRLNAQLDLDSIRYNLSAC
jgi:hypothetical protein